MQDNDPVSALELVRCIATARIVMPKSVVRLSAGRLNFGYTDQVSVLHHILPTHWAPTAVLQFQPTDCHLSCLQARVVLCIGEFSLPVPFVIKVAIYILSPSP